MKKALMLFAFAAFVASQSFATYIVVLKDGTRYGAKSKWTVVNGKALVKLENGQTLQLDPALIDVAKSEQMTKMGAPATANIIDLNPNLPEAPAAQQPSLGSQIRLRRPRTPQQAETARPVPAPAAAAPAPAPAIGSTSSMVTEKFERAFENVGIFEHKVTSNGGRTIRAELTVDTEERVFNAISAASFLMVRNAGVDGAQIDLVELFMKTTTGGAAGRFQMTRADAQALDARTMSQQDYFVRKVLY